MSRTAFVFAGVNGAAHAGEHLPLLRLSGFVSRWQTVTRAWGQAPRFAEFARALHRGDELPQHAATWPWRALAVAAMQLAMTDELEAHGEHADWSCGYSIGDVARSCHAGIFTFEEVVEFAASIGPLPVAVGATAAAHIGSAVDDAELRRCLAEHDVQCSAMSPRFVVYAGPHDAVAAAVAALGRAGIRSREIAACPLHTPLQQPLADLLARLLPRKRFAAPRRAVYSTLWRRPIVAGDDVAAELTENATAPCDFASAVRALHEQHGVTRFVDVGPDRHAQRFVLHHGGAFTAHAAGDLLALRVRRA